MLLKIVSIESDTLESFVINGLRQLVELEQESTLQLGRNWSCCYLILDKLLKSLLNCR